MKPFAKVFETERGQIAVLNHQDSDGNPAVVFMFDPGVDGLGICQFAAGFEDNEDGELARDAAFESITEDQVRQMVFKQIDGIREMWTL